MDASLSREERLRSKRRLERLFGQGKGGFVYPFRYIYIAAADAGSEAGSAGADAGGETGSAGADAVSDAVSAAADSPKPASVLFSVPKKYHKRANKRNLLRRRTREAYRLNKSLLSDGGVRGAEIAFIYSVKDVADFKRIEHAVRKIMSQIVERM